MHKFEFDLTSNEKGRRGGRGMGGGAWRGGVERAGERCDSRKCVYKW